MKEITKAFMEGVCDPRYPAIFTSPIEWSLRGRWRYPHGVPSKIQEEMIYGNAVEVANTPVIAKTISLEDAAHLKAERIKELYGAKA